MSNVTVRYRDSWGTQIIFHCPVCDHYVQKEMVIWEREPQPDNPGKVRHCRFCKGIWRKTRKYP